MTRRLLIFTSIVMLTSLSGCTMHRTCSSQDMIAMKESGFLPGQIESSCTTWGFDAAAIQTLSSSVATGMKVWEELEKAKREAAKK
jgi:hypothetical protein